MGVSNVGNELSARAGACYKQVDSFMLVHSFMLAHPHAEYGVFYRIAHWVVRSYATLQGKPT